MSEKVIPLKGILNQRAAASRYSFRRYPAAADVSRFVEWYWLLAWDLRGQPPHIQDALPYPSVNLVFERGNTGVVGISSGKFTRQLEGDGQILGVRFKPGALYPFVGFPVTRLTDTIMTLEQTFLVNTQRVEAEVFALRDEQAKVRYVESFLRERLPAYDENINLIEMIINHISSNPDLMRVDDLVEELGLNKRTVQDMFHRYVGVSPKWVINRYRLQEATERLDQGDAVQFTHLAHELGYFDQAHFIKDFKAIIGKTPTEYAAEVR